MPQINSKSKGKTITFYSYKGGVGRSMAMVNIGCLMATKRKKVLLIDWDLEAPGIHNFFPEIKNNDGKGLVDFITESSSIIDGKENLSDDFLTFFEQRLPEFIIKDVAIGQSKFNLDIIKAGKLNDDYTKKLNEIDWIKFYVNAPFFFKEFTQYLEANYDYILIDSRTGLADTSGICTMLMPQILVLVFALNQQNIDGVIEVAKQSINYRFNSIDNRKLTILPLPSRIDNQNPIELEKWIKIYRDKFELLFKELYFFDDCSLSNYFNYAKIPYKPIYAYGENIPVLVELTDNDFFISYHYAQFFKLIDDEIPIWDLLSVEELESNRQKAYEYFQAGLASYMKKEYQVACNEFELGWKFNINDDGALNNWGLALFELAKSKNNKILLLESLDKFEQCAEINPYHHSTYYNWGLVFAELAKKEKSEKYYQQSFDKFRNTIRLNSKDYGALSAWALGLLELAILKQNQAIYLESIEKFELASILNSKDSSLFNNWGNALSNLGYITKDKNFYNKSFEKYQKSIELDSQNSLALANYALALSNLAKVDSNSQIYIDSFEKYEEAIKMDPKNERTYLNWADALTAYAEIIKDESYYISGFEKYQISTILNPQNDSAFNDWGASIFRFGLFKKDIQFLEQSLEKFKVALSLNPKGSKPLHNWANVLFEIGKLKNDDKLFYQAIEKFELASQYDTEDSNLYYHWGNVHLEIAKRSEGKRKFDSYDKAIEKYELSLKYDGNVYNLSCVYALKGSKDIALKMLRKAIENSEVTSEYVYDDIDWNDYREDKEYKNILGIS